MFTYCFEQTLLFFPSFNEQHSVGTLHTYHEENKRLTTSSRNYISLADHFFLLKRPEMFAFVVDSLILLIMRAFISSAVGAKPPVKLDLLKQGLGLV